MSSDTEEMDTNKEEIDDEESNDSSGDDDDDDQEEEEEEEVDEAQRESELSACRNAIEANPYDYQSHVNYITLASKYIDLDHLRFARKKMSEIYPLTEQLWLDWLRDEQKLLSIATEKKDQLSELFERAVNDYLSVAIWIEYCQYRIGLDLSVNGIEELRNLFERALSSCGVHLISGNLIWGAYTDVEQAKLMGILAEFNQNSTENNKEKLNQQIEFILKLYQRRLSIPLRTMDSTFDEYKDFCQQYEEYLPRNYLENDDSMLKKNYEKALKRLEECEKFEEELDSTNRSLVTYKKYLEFEKEPSRIQCLYERAIVDHCLDGDLWISYLDFLDESLPSSTILQKIYERSLRNCPWVATLWIRYAEFAELTRTVDHSKLKSIFDQALNSVPTEIISFVNLQLAYLQYRRRHYVEQNSKENNRDEIDQLQEEIRRACESACDQYQELFLASNDAKLFLKFNGQLELFWIHLETKEFHSIDKARQIWNGPTLMNKTHNQMISNLWRNFYYMEVQYGDDKHARKVLYRALNHVQNLDYPETICELLLEHEKKFGTIEQVKEAKDKVKSARKKIIPVEQPKRSKQQNHPKAPPTTTKKEKVKEKVKEKPVQAEKTNGQNHESPRKRKLTPDDEQSAKKKVPETKIDSEGFKIPLPPPPPPLPSVSTSAKPTTTSSIPSTSTQNDHMFTVFIANLPFDADDETIRTALKSAGDIKEVRIVKHEWSGKSKGFGYVDFFDANSYQKALKLDHTLVNGRPMYVSAYDANKSASNDITKKFKYATSLEQNKLFLSDLPFSATKEQIEQVFQQFGFHPIEVRLVTHKSGKPKGLAYAEFTDAKEASQAVIKADGYEMDGHTIKVAISNPPQRKESTKLSGSTKTAPSKALSLGAAPKSSGPRGKGHSQISLVPTQVITSNSKTTTATTSSTTMSNNDFRNMLLNKK